MGTRNRTRFSLPPTADNHKELATIALPPQAAKTSAMSSLPSSANQTHSRSRASATAPYAASSPLDPQAIQRAAPADSVLVIRPHRFSNNPTFDEDEHSDGDDCGNVNDSGMGGSQGAPRRKPTGYQRVQRTIADFRGRTHPSITPPSPPTSPAKRAAGARNHRPKKPQKRPRKGKAMPPRIV